MVEKKQDDTATITETRDVTEQQTLTAEEERILRMRAGATLGPGSVLETKVDSVHSDHQSETRARLALMEEEILRTLNENPELREDRKKRIVDALRGQADD